MTASTTSTKISDVSLNVYALRDDRVFHCGQRTREVVPQDRRDLWRLGRCPRPAGVAELVTNFRPRQLVRVGRLDPVDLRRPLVGDDRVTLTIHHDIPQYREQFATQARWLQTLPGVGPAICASSSPRSATFTVFNDFDKLVAYVGVHRPRRAAVPKAAGQSMTLARNQSACSVAANADVRRHQVTLNAYRFGHNFPVT